MRSIICIPFFYRYSIYDQDLKSNYIFAALPVPVPRNTKPAERSTMTDDNDGLYFFNTVVHALQAHYYIKSDAFGKVVEVSFSQLPRMEHVMSTKAAPLPWFCLGAGKPDGFLVKQCTLKVECKSPTIMWNDFLSNLRLVRTVL